MTGGPSTARSVSGARRSALLIALAVLAAHGVTLAGDFVYDDIWVVVNNPFVKDAGNLARLLTGDLPQALPDGNRPFVVALYIVDHALFGLTPWGWHLHNLLWHLACALGVAALARRLSGSEPVARAAGLLFAVHAILTEAVAVVSYREDLVATTSIVVAMALTVRSRQSGRALPILPAGLVLLCGTNAKEIVPTFPLLLAAYDAAFQRGGLRGFLRNDAWTYAPLTLAAFGSRFWVDAWKRPEILGTVQGAEALAPVAAIATSGRIALAYLGQLLLPVGLSGDYATPVAERIGVVSAAGLAAVAAVLGVALWKLRRRPLPAFGLLWLLIALIPTAGFVPVQNLRADRYLYLPCVGYVLAAASCLVYGAEWIARRARTDIVSRKLLPTLLALVCVVYGGLAFARNRVWADEVTLWEHELRMQPRSLRAKVALMSEYLRRNRLADAERVGWQAVAEHPRSWQLQLNLGRLFTAQGRSGEALRALERAVALGAGDDPRVVENLAIARLQAGHPKRALADLDEAARRWPRDARIRRHVGQIALELGEPARAARALAVAVALAPGDAEAHQLLARARLRLGDVDGAVAAASRALAIDPDDAGARRLHARIRRRLERASGAGAPP